LNLLGIDFEDWYHIELVQKYYKPENPESNIILGIDKILNLLEQNNTYATFFMVGELLIKEPKLLDKIIDAGHEIAFHTMHHSRIDTSMTKEMFENEIKLFSELTSGKSKGFRAPSFSLNDSTSWIFDILEKHGYLYDSSVMPAKTRLYGLPNADKKPFKISSRCIEKNDPNGILHEFPLLTTQILGKTFPASGGFYLRFFPNRIIKNAILKNEKNKIPSSFYIHSWELTPEFMPKLNMPLIDHFITYHNLHKAYGKLDSLLKLYNFTSFEKFIKNYN
jgi:peptidoglycan-N-acetylglucosamine deacetylase